MQMCKKARLLEFVHDFIVFDAGTKKLCRHNQYFGVKAAQDGVEARGRHHLAHPGLRGSRSRWSGSPSGSGSTRRTPAFL